MGKIQIVNCWEHVLQPTFFVNRKTTAKQIIEKNRNQNFCPVGISNILAFLFILIWTRRQMGNTLMKKMHSKKVEL